MNEGRVLFVPVNRFGNYNCSVEIQKTKEGCRVFLRPSPGRTYTDEDDLLWLMDTKWGKQDKPLPVWVGKVKITKMIVPDYELMLSWSDKPLSFEEAVEFMRGFSTFKRG
jgi:hypothetical protein